MRAIFVAPALLLLAPLAFGDDSQPASTSAVYACASLGDDGERLACYDAAVGRLQAAEEAGEVTTVSRAEVEEVQKEAFRLASRCPPCQSWPCRNLAAATRMTTARWPA